MDWVCTIDRNRRALALVVAAIAALIGGRDDQGPITRAVRRAALALLRPAEAVARRLVVMAAEGVAAPPPRPAPVIPAGAARAGFRDSLPAFRLIERQPRLQPLRLVAPPRGVPRIRAFWAAPRPATAALIASPTRNPSPGPDTPVDAAPLRRRLAVLEAALADLPRQARRLALWRARFARRRAGEPAALAPSPLRFGRPPGWRPRPGRAVDELLRECNLLAHDALRRDTRKADTS
jgi:hypothetical protein